MDNGDIKVFFKNEKGIFRRILSKEQYKISKESKIILPKNHYSMGYVERIVSGIKWEDYEWFNENKDEHIDENKDDNEDNIDFYLDNK